MHNEDEQIPYFSPSTAPTKDQVASRDEQDYSTLKRVLEVLDESVKDLYKDFNAFDVPKDNLDAVKALLRQVDGRQEAYEILVPVLEMVKSAISSIEEQQKKGK